MVESLVLRKQLRYSWARDTHASWCSVALITVKILFIKSMWNLHIPILSLSLCFEPRHTAHPNENYSRVLPASTKPEFPVLKARGGIVRFCRISWSRILRESVSRLVHHDCLFEAEEKLSSVKRLKSFDSDSDSRISHARTRLGATCTHVFPYGIVHVLQCENIFAKLLSFSDSFSDKFFCSKLLFLYSRRLCSSSKVGVPESPDIHEKFVWGSSCRTWIVLHAYIRQTIFVNTAVSAFQLFMTFSSYFKSENNKSAFVIFA